MTQIELAEKGIISEAIVTVADKEGQSPEYIMEGLINGSIVIPKNVNRTFSYEGIGKGLKTKVNANIGTSPDNNSIDAEIDKLRTAVECGAHSVMDLSTGGDLRNLRRKILDNSEIMVGTVPLYGLFAETVRDGGNLATIDGDRLINTIEEQAKEGVDFVTIHCGLHQELFNTIDVDKRVAGIVSRGGALTYRWMKETGKENPLYEQFDRLLEIAQKYDLTLSLGDGLRPGGLADASDTLQLSELATLGKLVDRCREAKVQVMVEGPGHVPIQDVPFNMEIQKKMCRNAPFYVLGPLVIDCAPGYDHITAAIGGAVAAWHGADFLCYVTPAEHLCLPDKEDVKQGVIATLIAAQAGDIAKNVPGVYERNREMSIARKNLEWEKMFDLTIDSDEARRRRQYSESGKSEHCTMCGELCALKQQ